MKDNLRTKLHFFLTPPPAAALAIILPIWEGKEETKNEQKMSPHNHRTPSSRAPRYYSQTVIKLELNLNQWNSKDRSLVIH